MADRIPYTYVVLYYAHDAASGERLNIGIVLQMMKRIDADAKVIEELRSAASDAKVIEHDARQEWAQAKVIEELRAELAASEEKRAAAEAMIPLFAPGDCAESTADEHPDYYCWTHERDVWACVAAMQVERNASRAVLGPKLECGRYAVEHTLRTMTDQSQCLTADRDGHACAITPEFTAWRTAREERT